MLSKWSIEDSRVYTCRGIELWLLVDTLPIIRDSFLTKAEFLELIFYIYPFYNWFFI